MNHTNVKKQSEETTIACECSGRLRQVILSVFDFSAFAGFPSTVRHVPGLRCSKCRRETLPGYVINDVLKMAVIVLTRLPRRLSGQEARFIRRTVGATQMELARRLGIYRETVAKWETGGQISAQNDMLVRVFALMPLVEAGILPKEHVAAIVGDLREVRHDEPSSAAPAVDLGRYAGAKEARL